MGLIPWQATVQDDAGNAVPSPSVTVRNASDDSLADIFDLAGSPKTNPFDGTTEGFVQFQVYPGRYKIEGAKDASTAQTWYLDTTIDADDIDAGSINGIPIGAASRSTGAFTTIIGGTFIRGEGGGATPDTASLVAKSNSPTLLFVDEDGTHKAVRIRPEGGALNFQKVDDTTYVSTATMYGITYDAAGATSHRLSVGPSVKALLNSTGLGIGTTSPGASLDVADGRVFFGGNSIGGNQVTIADDAVASLTPPRIGGWLLLTASGGGASPEATQSAIIWFDTGSSLAIEKAPAWSIVGTNVDVSTSNVTGTTGTDTKTTVAVQSGVVKIENRTGSARNYQVTWL